MQFARFFYNTSLEEIEIDGLTVDSLGFESMNGYYSPFSNCKKLKRVILKNIDFNATNALSLQSLFYECNKLESVSFENIKLISQNDILDLRNMFKGIGTLKNVSFENVELSAKKQVRIDSFFNNCTNVRV